MPGFNIIDNRRIDRDDPRVPAPEPARHPDRIVTIGRGARVRILGGPIEPPAPAAPQPAPTHEGGAGYTQTMQAELHFLAVTHMVGEDTFYESASERHPRYTRLVRDNALTDPSWTAGLLRHLRQTANIRRASIVGAAHYARAARHAAGGPAAAEFTGTASVRTVVDSVMQRADEPGKFIDYWHRTFGRDTMPKSVKRGLADAILRLYTPYAVLKYDTKTAPYRFGDVLQIVQPRAVLSGQPGKVRRADALSYLIERRYGRTGDAAEHPVPKMHETNAQLRRLAADNPAWLNNPALLADAGMTWEDVLSLAGSRVPKKQLWEAAIPSMGLMALARNLRNFDKADISQDAVDQVCARFTDPEQIAGSRMFPYRWLAAYQAASVRWHGPLGAALHASTANIPAQVGRTLVLIDTSASMDNELSRQSTITRAAAAALFAFALANRLGAQHVDVYGFADHAYRFPWRADRSVLDTAHAFGRTIGQAGHGTRIAESLRQAWVTGGGNYRRAYVFTDEQTHTGPVDQAIPADVTLFSFNLGGYASTMIDPSRPNRFQLGGLTDATFRIVPMLEAGAPAAWPWQTAGADGRVR